MDLAALRARLGGPELARTTPIAAGQVAAAVLVAIIGGPAPGVLLTRRTVTLSSHAGQVAFPGGRIEAGEAPEQAALREAQEEIGLAAALVERLGRLPEHVTGTGYHVTPITALVAPGFVALPAAAEVDCVFELPLAVLLDPAAPRRKQALRQGRMREYWVWPHSEHYIWGATAAILVDLAQALR